MLRLIAVIFMTFAATMSLADDSLPTSAENPILTITHGDQTYQMDTESLRALPSESFTSSTIWTDGPQEFIGVPVLEILTRLGVETGHVKLTAANGYQIDVPVEHYLSNGALIAYERNGAPMTLRDKGPLWIVYPYDSEPRYQTEVIYANSIWQLDRIEVTD